MPCIVSIIYPRRPTSTFDLQYYLQTHMPLVQRLWQSHGLRKWEVLELNEESGFSVQAITHWDSVEVWKETLKVDASKEVFGDIPNFSNEQPIQLIGNMVGQQEGA